MKKLDHEETPVEPDRARREEEKKEGSNFAKNVGGREHFKYTGGFSFVTLSRRHLQRPSSGGW
jgi:hypothetical protein